MSVPSRLNSPVFEQATQPIPANHRIFFVYFLSLGFNDLVP